MINDQLTKCKYLAYVYLDTSIYGTLYAYLHLTLKSSEKIKTKKHDMFSGQRVNCKFWILVWESEAPFSTYIMHAYNKILTSKSQDT